MSLQDKIQYIRNNKIAEIDYHLSSSQGAGMIADALKVNSSLQSIDLFGNNIGDKGASKIAGSLKVNSSLQCINLSYTNINLWIS
jgi:hypothetical protein